MAPFWRAEPVRDAPTGMSHHIISDVPPSAASARSGTLVAAQALAMSGDGALVLDGSRLQNPSPLREWAL